MKCVGLIKRMICEQQKQTTAGEGLKSLNEKPMTDYMNIAIQCSLQISTNTPTPTCPTTIKCKESFLSHQLLHFCIFMSTISKSKTTKTCLIGSDEFITCIKFNIMEFALVYQNTFYLHFPLWIHILISTHPRIDFLFN